MRTFATKQQEKPPSSDLVKPDRAERARRNAILPNRTSYSFGRISIQPPPARTDEHEQEANRLAEQAICSQPKAPTSESFDIGGSDLARTAAPPIVHEALRSSGQPLDAEARAFMEPRFGHDFSRVRVHRDERAAQSADAVNAHAYTVGNDIVFGRGEYAFGTAQGRSLMAHELAHVVQRQNSTGPYPMLQKAAKSAKTEAGEYIADPYDATYQPGPGGITLGYGADITITFKANDRVDATKIAFIQTALSLKDGKPDEPRGKTDKEKKTSAARMIPSGKSGAGTHIDQMPDIRTPLYGMSGAKGNNLANPEPATTMKLTHIGWHYKDSTKKVVNEDPWMHDEPDLNSGDLYTPADNVMDREWSQHFESAAMAIDGNQSGTFYGFVEWGWTKRVGDVNPQLSEFKTKSANLPSPEFVESAKLWNAAKTSEDKEPIDVPVELQIISERADLWDSPDRRKKIATLPRGTQLGRRAQVDPRGRPGWDSVIVVGGASTGKSGWIEDVDVDLVLAATLLVGGAISDLMSPPPGGAKGKPPRK